MPITLQIVEGEKFEYPYSPPEGKYIRRITVGGVLHVLDSSLAHTIRINSVTADQHIEICLGDLPDSSTDPPPEGTVYYTACSFWAEIEGNGTDNEFLVEHNKNTKKLRAEIVDADSDATVWASVIRMSENSISVRFASPLPAGKKYEVILTYLSPTVGGCGCNEGYSEILEGNGVMREFLVLHELNTKRLITTIYDDSEAQVFASISREDLNTVKLRFASPPENGRKYEVIISKK
jgi:hypothetical protein